MDRERFLDALSAKLESILLRGYFCECTDTGMKYRQMAGEVKKLRETLAQAYDALKPEPKPAPVPNGQPARK